MNRLFHGSERQFDSFDPDLIGSGADPSSALGVWLTLEACVAADYSNGHHLLEVEAGPLRLAVARDRYTAIWGAPELLQSDREISRPMFEGARQILVAEGFDGVWCEMPGTDLESAVCIFDPSSLRIVRVHSCPNPAAVDHLCGCADAIEIDFGASLEEALRMSRNPTRFPNMPMEFMP